MIIRTYNEFINFISFTKNLRTLRSKINISIDLPEVIEEFPDSHPRGFIKEFKKRRTTIVETYLRVTKSIDSTDHKERIEALHLLAEHILYSRSLKMPLNAARVQLALMKQVINNRDNKRIQLELMRDFTLSSFGHPRSIKKFIKKLDIIEVPETGEELRDLKMGWDFHVHDSASYGRKSPVQLVIDAFIKGISELTIAYNNLEREDAVKEVLEAGKILGIRVNIAIEFSAMTNGKQFHYMYILPEFSSRKKKFTRFLKHKTEDFDAFLYELEENQKKRNQNVSYLIERFNSEHLSKINKGYKKGSIYYLNPLSSDIYDKEAVHKIGSRRLLGEFLYKPLKLVLEKRALYITALQNMANTTPNHFIDNKIETLNKEYNDIRSEYSELAPEKIHLKYFTDNEAIQAETAVSSLNEISNLAKKAGGSIKFIQPLEHGLEAAINMIIDNYEYISHTEIFNMFDSIETDVKDFIHFSNFIKYLNNSDFESLKKLLNDLNISGDEQKLINVIEQFQQKKIVISIGSDATGRSTLTPGMGFMFENRLKKHQRKSYAHKHRILPQQISDLVYEDSKAPKVPLTDNQKPKIICLGRVDYAKKNELGDEKVEKPINLLKAWEYVNPAIKNLLFILIGFIPAYYTVGIGYALLWFTITGSRNIFVDMISGNGFKPTEWSVKDINWTNLANSLFWTGFSVPILSFVKSRFDVFWQWEHAGSTYEFVKFFFINTANGMYLASHNYFRGFDKGTIRGNFFRSILAWPLAAAFAPIGNAILLPSIVQAKFWSDFVAAIIEGSGKYKNIIKLKHRNIKSLLPDFENEDSEVEILAILDIIYFMAESTRVKTVMKKQLFNPISRREKIKKMIRFKKPKKQPNQYYNTLHKWLKTKNNFNKICDYVIQHYNREQSLYLLQLISSHYNKTQNWVETINN